ncbi:MAG: hypothetical protein AB7G93_00010 [Bdellovibrionales bacterium]
MDMDMDMEQKTEWNTPEFEEVTLNCEVACYAPSDYDDDRA